MSERCMGEGCQLKLEHKLMADASQSPGVGSAPAWRVQRAMERGAALVAYVSEQAHPRPSGHFPRLHAMAWLKAVHLGRAPARRPLDKHADPCQWTVEAAMASAQAAERAKRQCGMR
jgi:hypothetical protein